MKILNRISLFAALVAASACNQPAKQQDATKKTDTVAVKTTNAQVADTANTADVFTAYIGLKDQFLKSDVAGIKTAALTLEGKLASIKGCSETATLAHQIAAIDDVKEQRAAFLLLSKDVVALVKGAKLKTGTIYVDYCPMADSGKGGYWLSLNKTIENPYFPEHMKECGQVKEQIN
jgi:Cu(I)/Ag(I) efflux system membrane fusion protein